VVVHWARRSRADQPILVARLGLRDGAALAGGWIAPGALVVWEEAAEQLAPEGFAAIDARRYGETHVTLLRALGGGADQTG